MENKFKVHSYSNSKSSSWSGGKTTELFKYPVNSDFKNRDFDFRISSATIETDESTFTSLPDYNRLLAILEGEMEIIHEGKYEKQLSTLESDSFHGSWKTTSKGRVRDFNVIYSDQFTLDFNFILLNEEKSISKASDFQFLFLLKDTIINGAQLKKYDLLEMNSEVELNKGLCFFEIRLDKI